MAQYQRQPTQIWWLSGAVAVLGGCIALCAALGLFVTTLVIVGIAVIVTFLLGVVLVQGDK